MVYNSHCGTDPQSSQQKRHCGLDRQSPVLILLLFLFAFLTSASIQAQDIEYTTADRQIFDRYLQTMMDSKHLELNQLIIETAQFFMGTPYVASTLEKEPEHIVINLRELDCTTLVENVLALSRTVKSATPSFETFCAELQRLRYRDGVIKDYTDRLHYFTDWIYENSRKNLVNDMTQTIGGEPYPLNLSFMSTHPDSYAPLRTNSARIEEIARKEKEISARQTYGLIPKAQIEACGAGMKDGDIVCFVTSIAGLDVSHVALIYRNDGKVGFIHASSVVNKVIIEPLSLSEYVSGRKSTTGVMIVRPLEE
ncbi:MAG: DUF1460 domain-containing protein [Tannerella sp.]|jgi:hypothetical protein|nr:DUF1460 domain-containing protein [Tannerella sp.]